MKISSISAARLDALIDVLHLNAAQLARSMNYDPSYLSRIRHGERTPADTEAFLHAFAKAAVHGCTSDEQKAGFAQFLGTDQVTAPTEEAFFQALCAHLSAETPEADNNAFAHFLQTLDAFDFHDYLRTIHFDEWKVPVAPIRFPVSKKYYGIAGSREAQLDFCKKTVLSPSKEPVYIYSSMSMEEMAQDPAFSEKFLYGLGMFVRKGLHLHVLHHLDRPLRELLMGLEGWIPLYMTGQLSPYYLESDVNGQDVPFRHMYFLSGSVMLYGEAITGHPDDASFNLTSQKKELEYYRKRTRALFGSAKRLMEIMDAEALPPDALFQKLEDQLQHTLPFDVYEDGGNIFRNMQIRLCKDTLMVITKTNTPARHFVCYHPQLVSSMEKLMGMDVSPILEAAEKA